MTVSDGGQGRPPLERSREALIEVATQTLLQDPRASLGDLAQRIGIGRTTLHRHFPTRAALVQSLAYDALNRLATAYRAVGLEPGHGGAADVDVDVHAVVGHLVEVTLPLGPRLMFLLRTVELNDDPEVLRRTAAMDLPLDAVLVAGQTSGSLDGQPPVWWLRESLYSLVYLAWEQIHLGRLAAHDAAPLVLQTWWGGAASTSEVT